jgi:hypothetical protein
MNFYITPVTSQTIAGKQVSAPKYLATDLQGLSFAAIPFGVEGWALVSLAEANGALAAETDVYAFPADLSKQLDETDVSALTTFAATANIPSDEFIEGATFADVLQIVAGTFLAAQAISGVTGAPIFTAGVTPDSPIAASGAAALVLTASQSNQKGTSNNKAGGTAAPAPVATSNGPYDFTAINANGTVADALISLSQQLPAGTLNLGTIGAIS